MAGLAKSVKNNTYVIRVENKKEFIKRFNKSKPSDEFLKSCRKAGKLFGE